MLFKLRMNYFANYAVIVQGSLARIHYIVGKILDKVDPPVGKAEPKKESSRVSPPAAALSSKPRQEEKVLGKKRAAEAPLPEGREEKHYWVHLAP